MARPHVVSVPSFCSSLVTVMMSTGVSLMFSVWMAVNIF
jgi:hypothetical protein